MKSRSGSSAGVDFSVEIKRSARLRSLLEVLGQYGHHEMYMIGLTCEGFASV